MLIPPVIVQPFLSNPFGFGPSPTPETLFIKTFSKSDCLETLTSNIPPQLESWDVKMIGFSLSANHFDDARTNHGTVLREYYCRTREQNKLSYCLEHKYLCRRNDHPLAREVSCYDP